MRASQEETRLAPIAVFAYNRPEKLAALMASLRKCEGFEESLVTIFVDGAKSKTDQLSVEAVRKFVENIELPNVSWIFGDVHRGLRNSIFAGVSELSAKFGRVIVFEDDLILSPLALRYFNSALSRYETEDRVWSICGYIYDAPSLRSFQGTFTLPFAHSWGWATWERAWSKFDLDNRPASKVLRSASFKSAFDVNGLYPFTTLLINSIEGRVDSWYVHWYYTVFQNGGVSVFPPRRVLDNYGLNQGTHGGALNPQDKLVRRPELLTSLPEFRDAGNVDYQTIDILKRSREAHVQRFIARVGSLKRRWH
jgi:hypothetical protein